MAKKKQVEAGMEYDVYEQTDGALLALESTETPDDVDVDLVWSGEAANTRDAIRQARKSAARLKKAPAANVADDPDVDDNVRKNREARVNEQLGINPRGSKKTAKKKSAKKKTTAKKKTVAKSSRKQARAAKGKTPRRGQAK